jgi:hypothetical protein
VLHDDRHVGFEHPGIVGVARDRLRIDKIVEAQMKGSSCAHRDSIWSQRFAIAKKIVIVTFASRSPALRMQAVSWEIKVRSLKALSKGMYPSATAHRRLPIASMNDPAPQPNRTQCCCGRRVLEIEALAGTFSLPVRFPGRHRPYCLRRYARVTSCAH